MLQLKRAALAAMTLATFGAASASAQTPAVAAGAEPETAPAVVITAPAMAPPLTLNANPISVDSGLFGKVYVSGQLTGLGFAQSHTTPNSIPGGGNSDRFFDLSNGMVAVQTVSGPFQFFIQAGAYSFPTIGTAYLRPGKNIDAYYGPLPVAYGKVVINPNLSIQAGSMPTLIGSEYAFTFQNTNIERGLLWNQEPVISKGVQLNYANGPVSLSMSVTDGFFSDHYNWFAGLLTYTINPSNIIAVNGGFNFSHTNTTKFRAPNAQNNSGILDVSYTYTKGPFWISPYFQYTTVSPDARTAIARGARTYSGAVLAKYSFTPEYTVGARAEYIASKSDGCRIIDGPACAPTNLLYGPGSDAFSLTVTPSWQRGVFFVRGEASYVRIKNFQPGFGFGSAFGERDQVRGLVETGLLF